uniref:Uncharacterized protein n=1 Tax=Plectus sambesii TaxID=2011161 RepID=A0A914VJF5_9BILA
PTCNVLNELLAVAVAAESNTFALLESCGATTADVVDLELLRFAPMTDDACGRYVPLASIISVASLSSGRRSLAR